jgi:hypothetical protein
VQDGFGDDDATELLAAVLLLLGVADGVPDPVPLPDGLDDGLDDAVSEGEGAGDGQTGFTATVRVIVVDGS